jgi:hypothetical protein
MGMDPQATFFYGIKLHGPKMSSPPPWGKDNDPYLWSGKLQGFEREDYMADCPLQIEAYGCDHIGFALACKDLLMRTYYDCEQVTLPTAEELVRADALFRVFCEKAGLPIVQPTWMLASYYG